MCNLTPALLQLGTEEYCVGRNAWLSAVPIPVKENNDVGYMLRLLTENTK